MKKLLPSFVVLAFGAVPFSAQASDGSSTSGKIVDIAIYNDVNRADRELPAKDGSAGSFGGGYTLGGDHPSKVQLNETYKVVTDAKGNLTVVLHRVFTKNETKTTSDVTLSVCDKEPAADKPVALKDGATVAAYLKPTFTPSH